jgi:hypothetical protein
MPSPHLELLSVPLKPHKSTMFLCCLVSQGDNLERVFEAAAIGTFEALSAVCLLFHTQTELLRLIQ